MTYNSETHHRRSVRLKGYDYAQPGWYYITIVTQNREIVFGKVIDGKMVLNNFGRVAQTEWLKTMQIRKN